MKKIAISSLIGGILLATGAQAEITGNVAFSSDYMFRGISQTDNAPAISGGFDYSHENGFYAGVWASNVDSKFFDDANIEIDTYFGYAGGSEQFSYDVGFLRYNYPGTGTDDNNTNEIYGSVGYDLDVVALSAGVAMSNDFFGLDSSQYYSFGADIPVGDYSIALGYGIQDIDDGENYSHYSVGISGEVANLGLDLTWHHTSSDLSDPDNLTDSRVVFTVSKSL